MDLQYVLHGRVITMKSEVDIIEDGYVVVVSKNIKGIYKSIDQIPEIYSSFKVVETNCDIFPGLMDLHNHLAYNVISLWNIPKKYTNRSQWRANPSYRNNISYPVRNVLAKYSITSKSIVRYTESKALMGGTTTGQGMRTRVNGGEKLYLGSMRNIEEPINDSLLPSGGTIVDLRPTQENIRKFRRSINNPKIGAYMYHHSEGVDELSRMHFTNLKENNLINEKLIGIHSLALNHRDFEHLADKNAKVVWSPFSNLLLYGQTLNLNTLKKSGVKFSLGCDWSPTGSKNLLQELKVAYHINNIQGHVFTPYELVSSVTKTPSEMVQWTNMLGTIEKNKLADFLLIKKINENPYEGLIKSTVSHVNLVIVNGVPRYGNSDIMTSLIDQPLDQIAVDGEHKSFYLFNELSEINDVSFTDAESTLKTAMSDLDAFIQQMEPSITEKASLMDKSDDELIAMEKDIIERARKAIGVTSNRIRGHTEGIKEEGNGESS